MPPPTVIGFLFWQERVPKLEKFIRETYAPGLPQALLKSMEYLIKVAIAPIAIDG